MRSGAPVNGGFSVAEGTDLTAREQFHNELQPRVPSPWGSVRLDAFTHHYALEYMKKSHLELVYIAYGETDDFAHDGNYEAYLKAAYNTDTLIRELWDFIQKNPFYKDNTLFIITTDHGRGTDPLESWKSHGNSVKGADGLWFVLFGKGVSSLDELSKQESLHSDMVALTVLMVLNMANDKSKMKGKVLELNAE